MTYDTDRFKFNYDDGDLLATRGPCVSGMHVFARDKYCTHCRI